jgi:hypothetical protein
MKTGRCLKLNVDSLVKSLYEHREQAGSSKYLRNLEWLDDLLNTARDVKLSISSSTLTSTFHIYFYQVVVRVLASQKNI